MMMKILRGARGALLPLVLCCGLLLVAGCGAQTVTKGAQDGSDASVVTESGAKAGQPVSGEKKETAAKELTVKVYYPNDDGTKLVAVSRKIKTDKEDKYTAVMRSLLAGTQEKGQTVIIPKQAKLQSVKVADGTAKVSFSRELAKNFVGGSTGEEMLVGSIVDTLTEFPEVKRVQILIDGKAIESLSGHMDLTQPLARMKQLL